MLLVRATLRGAACSLSCALLHSTRSARARTNTLTLTAGKRASEQATSGCLLQAPKQKPETRRCETPTSAAFLPPQPRKLLCDAYNSPPPPPPSPPTTVVVESQEGERERERERLRAAHTTHSKQTFNDNFKRFLLQLVRPNWVELIDIIKRRRKKRAAEQLTTCCWTYLANCGQLSCRNTVKRAEVRRASLRRRFPARLV